MGYDDLPLKSNHWVRLAILVVILIGLSYGIAYLFQSVFGSVKSSLHQYGDYVYLLVFAVTLASNLTLVAPVPIATAIMMAAATVWNPVLIALAAAVGGTIGEMSGYYAGYLGKKIAISEYVIGYERITGWMKRYGPWAIFFLALQPILPFDLGGLIAGAARMPIPRFMLALFAGKLPKYIILCYSGIGFMHFLPNGFG